VLRRLEPLKPEIKFPSGGSDNSKGVAFQPGKLTTVSGFGELLTQGEIELVDLLIL